MKRSSVPMAMADETTCCNLKTTLDLVGLFFCIFVFLLVVFVYVRYLLLWRLPADGPAPDRRPPKAGLDPSAIAALPSFAYQRRGTGGGGVSGKAKSASVECAVCLSTVEEGETLRVLPACEHMFHAQCIDLWLLSKSTCPICRAEAQPVVKAASSSATVVQVRTGETTSAAKEENTASSSSSSLFPGMWSARLRFGDLESNQ